MAIKNRFGRSTRYTANLLASYLVVFSALGIMIAAMLIDSTQNAKTMLWVVAAGLILLLLPALIVGFPKFSSELRGRSLFFEWRKRKRAGDDGVDPMKPWKRRRARLEPANGEYATTFIPERRVKTEGDSP